MQSETSKHVDVARLKADLAAAGVEILSAHCAADRIRLKYSPEDIVAFAERNTLKKAITSSQALYRFFSQLEVHLRNTEESDPVNV
jgi:hypothetical protein